MVRRAIVISPSRRAPYFICLTRFLPRKNIPVLLKGYAAYRRAVGSDAARDLAICGSGAGLDDTRSLVRDLDLDQKVHLPGFVAYSALGDWYAQADALIHPALHEQWGLVLNEACAAGLPIISSRTVGAAAELVKEGENGYTFDPSSVADLDRVLQAFHALSATECDQMGDRSRAIVADFGPARFGNGFTRAVSAALGESASS
ncbi:MAG: glycosyltransferase [Cyanobacteria bacterium J06639_1]